VKPVIIAIRDLTIIPSGND